MRNAEKECTVFCPRCNADKYDVYRVPTGREGVFAHVTEPPDLTNNELKFCLCGETLTRKP